MISQTHYNYLPVHDVPSQYTYSQPLGSPNQVNNVTDYASGSWKVDAPNVRPVVRRCDTSMYHRTVSLDRQIREDSSDSYSSDRSPRDASSSSPKPPPSSQHAWVQRSQVTTSKALNHLVMEFSTNGVRSFFCGWAGCKHPVGFAQKPQLITHIRSVHLQEKPFVCTTCNTQFSRKQEASRHVLSMNSGRKYKCSGCHQAFSRKNYRDAHEESCMYEVPSATTSSQPKVEYGNYPSLHSSPV